MKRAELLKLIRSMSRLGGNLSAHGGNGEGNFTTTKSWMKSHGKTLDEWAEQLSVLLDQDSAGSEDVDTSRLTMLMDDEAEEAES